MFVTNVIGRIFQMPAEEIILGLMAFVAILGAYSVYQQNLVVRLRRQLAEKQSHSDLLRNMAMFDSLTGLYNRRFAEHRLAEEVARCARKSHPLTILTIDLNNFKQINDTYGHAAGDQVLREFAARLTSVIRGSDMAIRLGGDEFLIVLPECTVEQLEHVLHRLDSLEVAWRDLRIPVTFSTGWKQLEQGETPEMMLRLCDEALYANKRGRKEPNKPVSVRGPNLSDKTR